MGGSLLVASFNVIPIVIVLSKKEKRSEDMLKQGRFMIIIGTMVLVIAGWFFPFNLWQKLFFSIGMIGIGISFLLETFSSKSKNISK